MLATLITVVTIMKDLYSAHVQHICGCVDEWCSQPTGGMAVMELCQHHVEWWHVRGAGKKGLVSAQGYEGHLEVDS